jgi:hypothetical protein
MFIHRIQDFIDHPLTRVVDGAAVATSAAYFFPDARAAIHEWGIVFTDLAPIAAFVWLVIQSICKVIVTAHTLAEKDKDDE